MSILFSPFQIGSLTCKNRLVRSATAERAFNRNGTVGHSLISFYERLAQGGVGLIITGYAYVHPSGRCTPLQAGFSSWEHAQGWREVLQSTRTVAPDVKVFLQIAHGGRQIKVKEGEEALAPSAILEPATGVLPRAMAKEEIEEILDSFARAAGWAREVGFDGIQLHAAHGYLISQFTSPHTNRRRDEWGGSPEKRRRFILEAYRRSRKAVGEDFPLVVKLNINDYLPGGIFPEEAREVVRALCLEGIDGVELSGGTFESAPATCQLEIDSREKEAYFRKEAQIVREAASCPILLVGGMRSREVMEEILENGEADFISLSRPLIREPDLPNLLKKGKERSDCISCNGCLRNSREVTHCVVLRRSARKKRE